jgi:hypothetical protein
MQEFRVQVSRREAKGSGSFTLPLLAIVALIICYVVLAQWQDLPHFFNSAVAAVHWPLSG